MRTSTNVLIRKGGYDNFILIWNLDNVVRIGILPSQGYVKLYVDEGTGAILKYQAYTTTFGISRWKNRTTVGTSGIDPH